MDDYLPANTSITTPLSERPLEDMTRPPVMQAPARDYGVDTSTSTNQQPDVGVWRAGWELDTIPGAMMNRRDAGISFEDDGTDPFAENKGTKFELMPEYFTDIFNKQALAARRAQIEREQELRAVQDRSPWGAAGASLALQLVDPTMLIPGANLVKVGRGVYRFAGSAAKVGAAAAGATAVQEAVLQSQQQLRTGEESAIAIGGSFVLGGMLGGGLSLLTKPEIRKATTGLDSILNTRPGPDGAVASGSAVALTDMATKLRAGERVTTEEVQEWAKSARIEARNGRDATPETIARWEEIDRLSAVLEREASVARASEIEVAARTAFGGDGDRLVRGGGLQVVQSVEDLPARSDGLAHPTDVRGVFDGNKAYIVADNVTPDEVPSVLLHEVGVHYGMERMIGAENFRVLLDDVMARAQASEARFAEALAAVPKDTPVQHQAEEVLAYLVENAPELGIVQRVIAAVKQFIRQVSGGSYAGLNEADIRQLAVAALRKWNPEARPAQVGRPRYAIGRKQAMALNIKPKMPENKEFAEAVANTPAAKIIPEGLVVDVVRFQKPEQDGSTSVRTGVFYLPKGSPNAKHYRNPTNYYGGKVMHEGETLLRAPLFVKGATGGKAPETAFDAIKGKGAMAQLDRDVMSAVNAVALKRDGLYEENIINLLEKYGADSNLAYDIIENSKQGNQLRYALQENIIAHAVREAGYDSVVGYSKGKSGLFISEVFDVRETTYPAKGMDSDTHPDFDPISGQAADVRYSRAKTDTPEFKKWSSLLGPSGMSRLMKATGDKTVVDGLERNAKALGNLLEGVTGRAKGNGSVNIPSAVVGHMLGVSKNDEVFGAIVRAIPVDVMDLLARQKLTPELLLRDKSVLEDVLAVNGRSNVALPVDEAATLVRAVADAATEIVSLARRSLEDGVALTAGKADTVSGAHSKNITETAAFSRWFGKSKVVDADGKPLVVYHGSARDLQGNAFDPKLADSEGGAFYFSHSPLMKNPATNANDYARERPGGSPNVTPVYLKMENPLEVGVTTPLPQDQKEIGRWLDEIAEFNRRLDRNENAKPQFFKDAIRQARKNGHDGVIVRNVRDVLNDDGSRPNVPETDVYIAFEPTQIKSATGNDGSFSPDNPDIRYSRSQEKAKTAPEPIRAALENGQASLIADVGMFYSRAGEKREKAGIIVYHGSPHDFDRFLMDKIGTGEGAQAYGHGLYFAESEGVAKSYRDALQHKAPVSVDGVDGGPRYILQNAIQDARKYPADQRAAKLQEWLDETEAMATGKFAPAGMAENVAEIKRLLASGEVKPDLADAGKMYEVRINADPDQFLDWDKPLSEQSHVWDKLRQNGVEVPHGAGGWTGTDAEFKSRFGDVLNGTPYENMARRDILGPILSAGKDSDQFVSLVRQTHPEAADRLQRAIDEMNAPTGEQLWRNMRGDPVETTQVLNQAGIPGIKYLDAGSRAAGDGSRNYVVFDDKLIEIVRKYSRGASRNERIAAQAETLAKALASIDDPAAFSAALAARGGSVGAEIVDKETREDLAIYGRAANAVASVTGFLNPILRTRSSPVAAVNRIGQKLFSDTIYSNMHMQGRTMGPAAEDFIKSQAQAMMGEAAQKYEALYQEGRKAGMRLTKNQFSEAISAAMRRKDEHEVPAVAKAAKMWRDVVFDPLKRMAQETRIKGGYLLDPDIEAKFADSYLHRMANHKRLTADEFGFKNAVAGWMENSMRNQYAKEADEVRARLAAFEQDKVDLSLDPDARLAELEGLDKAYEDLDLRFAREANMRREISSLTSKAVLARQKGDKGTMKAAYDEIRKVKAAGGKEFDDYMRQFYTLNRRRKNVDLGFAGMAERQDDLRQKLEDVNDANLRAMDRLVAKGQKLERDLAKLDPVTRSERIAELREQMTGVLERQDKAAERLFKQVENVEKAKARAALQVLKEKRAGGIKEALAGNTEAKASADEIAREKALDEQIRKYVSAEQKRSERLAEIGRRIERLDALDLDGQAAELRAAVNEIVKQQSDMSIGRGERSQRIKDRMAKVDPAQVQKRIDEVDKRIAEIEREFYDKWEIKNAGEGVDLHAMVARPRFTEWAKSVADDAFDFYSGRAPEAGTVPDFLAPIKSGPLKERTLPVPDEVLEPWLENDIGAIAQKYIRSMLGQIEVARKFGSTTMEDELAEVTDAYRVLRETVNAAKDTKAAVEAIGQNSSLKDAFEAWRRGDSETKVTKERIATWLEKREQSDKDDILAGRDLLLGRYAMEENQSDLGKISRVAIAYNFARYMGGYIVGSLTDIYRPAMVHGLGHYLSHGIKPLLTNLEGVRLAAKEAQKAGIGVERWTHSYVTSAAGIGDPYAQGTALERFMDKVSKTAATWNGMTLFNDFTRSIGGIDAMDKILLAATKKTDTPYLAMLGIDPGMAQRIADQFKLHGRDIRGTLVAETDNWTDKEAVRIFRAAVSKDVNSIFVERSVGDVPLFINRPLGRMITQFRTFNLASNQRVLMRGLQEDQSRFVGALVAMSVIGMMVAALRSWRGGEDRWEKFKKSAENPGFLIGEGLDNSGIFALFFEGANTIEKLSQPSGVSFNPIKQPLRMAFPGASQQGESTRFVRRSPLESVLGPSAGIPQQVAQALGGDTKAMTSLTPFTSHSPFREMIQALSGNSAYGF